MRDLFDPQLRLFPSRHTPLRKLPRRPHLYITEFFPLDHQHGYLLPRNRSTIHQGTAEVPRLYQTCIHDDADGTRHLAASLRYPCFSSAIQSRECFARSKTIALEVAHRVQSIVGDFWTDTLFNPIWAPTPTRAMPFGMNTGPQSICSSSPESSTQDYDSTESSFLSLSYLDFDSPPQSAVSTAAVLGSARLSGAFEDDYDRPEASPNFVRKLLRRSKSLRRQARMRDGDFCDSDDERDFSVASEWGPIVRPTVPVPRSPTADTSEKVDSETHSYSERMPSRLSRRVKVPSPINTFRARGPTGAKVRRKEYQVEVGRVDGSELTSSSESGFEADDEHDGLRGRTKIDATAQVFVEANDKRATALLSTPPKKSYAAIVATSPPRTNTPESKAVVPQSIQAARILEARRGDALRAFEWRPFVEPFDV